MTKVAIIQKEIPHYRIRFFEEVSAQASTMGLDVIVYCVKTESLKTAFKFAQRGLPIYQFKKTKNGPFWLKGLTAALAGTDIVVAPQELQCLNVPYLWANRHRLCKRWIWWGHGYNFQAVSSQAWTTRLYEAVKRYMTPRAAGLITYTKRGAQYWMDKGLPSERVVPFMNTIDVEGFRKIRSQISLEALASLRSTLKLNGKHVLLFSGRLYKEKKVDFLLRAFRILQLSHAKTALLVIGDGAERASLETLANSLKLSGVHFLGEITKELDLGLYFSLADLLVIPGAVGLAIVHGFSHGLPLVTTEQDIHGPEIDYLSHDNGVLTPYSERLYAQEIGKVLDSPSRLRTMQEAARCTADQLSLDGAAHRFLSAIVQFSVSRDRSTPASFLQQFRH